MIRVKKLSPEVFPPEKKHWSDAGYDLVSLKDYDLYPGERVLIPTGLSWSVPENYVGFVCPRSGMAIKHGITVLNAPGVIDSGFLGDVGVILYNTNREGPPYHIHKGDKIAQMVVVPLSRDSLVLVDNLGDSERGSKGFGSSGR